MGDVLQSAAYWLGWLVSFLATAACIRVATIILTRVKK